MFNFLKPLALGDQVEDRERRLPGRPRTCCVIAESADPEPQGRVTPVLKPRWLSDRRSMTFLRVLHINVCLYNAGIGIPTSQAVGAGHGGGGGGGGAGCVSHSPLFLFLNSPSPLFRWPPPKKLNRLRHGSPKGPEFDSWAQMVEEENACHCPLTTHDIAQQACAYMCAHTTLLCTCIYTHIHTTEKLLPSVFSGSHQELGTLEDRLRGQSVPSALHTPSITE